MPLFAVRLSRAFRTQSLPSKRVLLHSGLLARGFTALLAAEALTIGRHVFVTRRTARQIASRSASGARLISHELAHVAQFSREGAARFLLRYVREYARGRRRGLSHSAAYRAISFEEEAAAAEVDAFEGAGSRNPFEVRRTRGA
jgi:hypothetical protein